MHYRQDTLSSRVTHISSFDILVAAVYGPLVFAIYTIIYELFLHRPFIKELKTSKAIANFSTRIVSCVASFYLTLILFGQIFSIHDVWSIFSFIFFGISFKLFQLIMLYAFIFFLYGLSFVKYIKDNLNYLKSLAGNLLSFELAFVTLVSAFSYAGLVISLFLKWYGDKMMFDILSADEAKRKADTMENMAYTDEKTQAYNYRYFLKLYEDYRVENTPFALIMFDIDDFKTFNTNYGHMAGDEVLISLAQMVQGLLPAQASLCRYGGEEFVIMIPHVSKQKAAFFTHDLCRKIEAHRMVITDQNQKTHSVSITVSMGFTYWDPKQMKADGLLESAAENMRLAKETGKNKVI